MGKLKTAEAIISKIISLRSKGYSISEISLIIGKSKSVVSKYTQGINILPKYKS